MVTKRATLQSGDLISCSAGLFFCRDEQFKQITFVSKNFSDLFHDNVILPDVFIFLGEEKFVNKAVYKSVLIHGHKYWLRSHILQSAKLVRKAR